MEILKIENFDFTYPLKDKKALNNINLSVREGDFILLCGKSGCGKSTLLRNLKPSLAPHGEKQGEILYCNKPINKLDLRTEASEIGYVLQNPDNQIVTDKVWHELAFGMESLGYKSEIIRVRVAEMASYFGIESWFYKKTTDLSGGQKQLLNLASIMTMNPKVLILDEPTSQLDPIAASEFLETIKKINLDLGTTIILSEHRLEEVFEMADNVIVMEHGNIIANTYPSNIAKELNNINSEFIKALPTATRIYMSVSKRISNECPINIRDGRRWLKKYCSLNNVCSIDKKNDDFEDNNVKKDTIIELKDVWFKYEKNTPDVIKGLSIKISEGEVFSVVGGNGVGKSTTISVMSGINKPYRGKVYYKAKNILKYKAKELFYNNLGVLPQNPQCLFVKKTVMLDLLESLDGIKISKDNKNEKILEVSNVLGINKILKMHPYDLSGGEMQKVALAKILLLEPKVIILDEPTKGIDNIYKNKLIDILSMLKSQGKTIIIVTHDIEFAAQISDRCAMFFDGNIVSLGKPKEFFSENNFYTTAASKISRGIFKNTVTCNQIINCLNENNKEKCSN